ncbi:hypothetical protein EMVG_00198 [Emiliania huxleyi virus PS401]|nr:hypothetical protein EMVG_00198 [Emiliania huxleyi virus PS401]
MHLAPQALQVPHRGGGSGKARHGAPSFANRGDDPAKDCARGAHERRRVPALQSGQYLLLPLRRR